ncbi:MAG: universal stress protein [Acidobacteria bacterium]|nr:universal stress protein [Acidobacteriota bacterium]
MKRFKNILIVTKGSKDDRQSLRRAVDLSKRNNAKLSLVEVIEVSDSEISRISSKLKGRDLSGLLVQDRKAGIDALLKETDFSLSRLDVVFGVPFIKIIQHVHRYDFDLVIMAAEGKGELKQRLFGTTTMHLMRKCPCPLWVLKPSADVAYRRILAAVDPVEPDNVKENLNQKIMELATSMAEIEKADLHVAHVWDLVGESLLLRRGVMTQGDVKAMVAEEKEERRRALEGLMMQHSATDIVRKSHLLRGNPGEVIPEFASKKDIDLVVMGTVSRHGIAGLLIGNTAEQVIQRVDASVLTVKPLGFVTPVL